MALPEDRSIDPSKFPAKVRRFVEPGAPPQMRMMVARGMVPMKPLVQVCALYQLWVTGDDAVRREAELAVGKIPVGTVRSIAQERILPVVLDWLADRFRDNLRVVRTLLSNRQTDGDTFLRLAKTANEEMCEALATNQARLLDTPGLIEALYLNRNTRASTADRVADFGIRNGVDLSTLPCYEEMVAAIQGSTPLDADQAAAADAAFREAQAAVAQIDDAEAERQADELEREERDAAARRSAGQPEEPEAPRKKLSAAGRIRELNIAQKVRMATIGNKTERGLLIRDSNKIVSRAVIRSPAISDSEALAYASIKSLPDEVVNFMASNKKWIRHYQMKKTLIMNPKCPTADAIRFLRHMRQGDLKAIARSRGLPGPVAKAAKQLLKQRMGG